MQRGYNVRSVILKRDIETIENLDVVAATLTSTYILKTTDSLDFNDFETYINLFLDMRAKLSLKTKE